MTWFIRFALTFLIVSFNQSLLVQGQASPWSNLESANAFVQAFLGNVGQSDVFNQDQLDDINSIGNTIMRAMYDIKGNITPNKLQALNTAFASAVAEIAVSDTGGQNIEVTTNAIGEALNSAFYQTTGSGNTAFVNEMYSLINTFARASADAIASESVAEQTTGPNQTGGQINEAAASASAFAGVKQEIPDSYLPAPSGSKKDTVRAPSTPTRVHATDSAAELSSAPAAAIPPARVEATASAAALNSVPPAIPVATPKRNSPHPAVAAARATASVIGREPERVPPTIPASRPEIAPLSPINAEPERILPEPSNRRPNKTPDIAPLAKADKSSAVASVFTQEVPIPPPYKTPALPLAIKPNRAPAETLASIATAKASIVEKQPKRNPIAAPSNSSPIAIKPGRPPPVSGARPNRAPPANPAPAPVKNPTVIPATPINKKPSLPLATFKPTRNLINEPESTPEVAAVSKATASVVNRKPQAAPVQAPISKPSRVLLQPVRPDQTIPETPSYKPDRIPEVVPPSVGPNAVSAITLNAKPNRDLPNSLSGAPPTVLATQAIATASAAERGPKRAPSASPVKPEIAPIPLKPLPLTRTNKPQPKPPAPRPDRAPPSIPVIKPNKRPIVVSPPKVNRSPIKKPDRVPVPAPVTDYSAAAASASAAVGTNSEPHYDEPEPYGDYEPIAEVSSSAASGASVGTHGPREYEPPRYEPDDYQPDSGPAPVAASSASAVETNDSRVPDLPPSYEVPESNEPEDNPHSDVASAAASAASDNTYGPSEYEPVDNGPDDYQPDEPDSGVAQATASAVGISNSRSPYYTNPKEIEPDDYVPRASSTASAQATSGVSSGPDRKGKIISSPRDDNSVEALASASAFSGNDNYPENPIDYEPSGTITSSASATASSVSTNLSKIIGSVVLQVRQINPDVAECEVLAEALLGVLAAFDPILESANIENINYDYALSQTAQTIRKQLTTYFMDS